MKGKTQNFFEFFGFRLDPEQRLLVRHGERVNLKPKPFDTLLFLVQNRGRVLEKEEIMKALWPESFVEENNLSQHISSLRKVLGDDQNGNTFIQTIPRRGYKFIAPVRHVETATHAGPSPVLKDYWTQHAPFRGLRGFEEQDAWLFFGRNAEVQDLLVRLQRSPVLAVVGNSGCGKSSLVRAGLIPALRADRSFVSSSANPLPSGDLGNEYTRNDQWRAAIVRPSESPFDFLAETLPQQLAPELSAGQKLEFIAECRQRLPEGVEALRNAIGALVNATVEKPNRTCVLLVVDQFEELFTLTSSPEVRQGYIDSLLAASRGDGGVMRVQLVLVIRADFYHHCLEYSALSQCLGDNQYNVPRMNRDQLCEATEKRLSLASAHLEAGLMDLLVEDVGSEPGNLALLEHALDQLWERCGGFGCTLSNGAYSAIGRLRGALSAHADKVYDAMTDAGEKLLAKRILLELVHLGEDAPDTRRRVRKADLLALGSPGQVESLLAGLTTSRLIAMSGGEGEETFAEVSHETLIREWSTLRAWIEESRQDLLLERRLLQAAADWKGLHCDPSALLQGVRLAQGEEWLLRNPSPPRLLQEFLGTSRIAWAEREEHKPRRQKIAVNRIGWLSCSLAGLLLAVTVAARFFGAFPIITVLGLGLVGMRDLRTPEKRPTLPIQSPIRSLAVLPLVNLSGDSSQDYFADGMTDELITVLSELQSIQVTSLTSVNRFRKTSEPLSEIAGELQAEAVVEGTVVRSGDRVRVTIQLISIASRSNLWAASYERPGSDILTVQADIAREVALHIQAEITPSERAQLERRRSIKPEALEEYFLGRYYWNRRNPGGLREAIGHFQKAVSADPNYAAAYAGLADCYLLLPLYDSNPPSDSLVRAKAVAQEAIRLDDSSAEAHASLANVLEHEWDFSGAEREFLRAIQLSPGYATAHQWFGEFLNAMNRMDESLEQYRVAMKLDPFSPVIRMEAALPYRYHGQYGEAIRRLREAVKIDPSFAPTHGQLGYVLSDAGNQQESIREFELAEKYGLGDMLWIKTGLGRTYSRIGNWQEARHFLSQLQKHSQTPTSTASQMAAIFETFGDNEKAVEYLQRAYRSHESELIWLGVEPSFKLVRSDPRVRQIVKLIGLPKTATADWSPAVEQAQW